MNEDKYKELLTTPLQYSHEEPSDRTFVVPPANLIIPKLELQRIILELDRIKKKKLFEDNLWIQKVFSAHPNAHIIDEADSYGKPLIVYTDNNGITRVVSENSLMDFDTDAPTISSYNTNSQEEKKRRLLEKDIKRENPELWLYYYGSPEAWNNYTSNKAHFDVLQNSAELASLLYGATSKTGRWLLGEGARRLGLTGLGQTAKVVFDPYTIPGAITNSALTAPFAVDMMNNGVSTENAIGVGLGALPYAGPALVRGYNTIGKTVRLKYVAPYVASRILNRSINANPKGQILVSDSYFYSPDNWYRITNTPEVYGIQEVGKAVTTRDAGILVDVPSDRWRTSVLELPIIRDKEGFFMLDPNRRSLGSRRLLEKAGSAHGNTSQASKGLVWSGTISNSKRFPTVILEGQAARQVPMGLNRTTFKLTPWEDIPMGERIGFHTGEMPLDNLRYFLKLGNGKYSYQGIIIPDKRINVENY